MGNKQYYKMNKAWKIFFIDTVVGPSLSFLAMKEPNSAQALSDILMDVLKKESQRDMYQENPDRFIMDMTTKLQGLVGTYMGHRLLKYLREGVPRTPSILVAPARPMGGLVH